MDWKKIFAALVLLYLAAVLPLLYLNEQAVEKCRPACSREGFDKVIGTTQSEQGLQCRCFDSLTREEKHIIAG